jgi:hypothetical protein
MDFVEVGGFTAVISPVLLHWLAHTDSDSSTSDLERYWRVRITCSTPCLSQRHL